MTLPLGVCELRFVSLALTDGRNPGRGVLPVQNQRLCEAEIGVWPPLQDALHGHSRGGRSDRPAGGGKQAGPWVPATGSQQTEVITGRGDQAPRAVGPQPEPAPCVAVEKGHRLPTPRALL